MFACVYMLLCEDEFTIEAFKKTKENCKSFKGPHLLLQTIAMKVAATFIVLSTHGSSKEKHEHLFLKSIPRA